MVNRNKNTIKRKTPKKVGIKTYLGISYRKTTYTDPLNGKRLYQIIGVKGAMENPRLTSEEQVKFYINSSNEGNSWANRYGAEMWNHPKSPVELAKDHQKEHRKQRYVGWRYG